MKGTYHYNTFISCDIETTGLNPKRAELLSVSMIADTNTSFINAIKVKNLPFIDVIVVKDVGGYYEPKAMQMNAEVLGEIAEINFTLQRGEVPLKYIDEAKAESILMGAQTAMTYKEQLEALGAFSKTVYASPKVALFIMSCFVRYVKAECLDGSKEVELGGKNFGKFDFQILTNFFDREVEEDIFKREILPHVSYRFLEVGSMFRLFFGKLVSLGQIVKLFGKEDVEHKAYADGIDTVKAARLATLKAQNPEVSLEELAKGVG